VLSLIDECARGGVPAYAPTGRLAGNRTGYPNGRTLMDLLVLLIIVLIILSVAGAAFVSPLVLVLLIVAVLLFIGPYRGRRGRL